MSNPTTPTTKELSDNIIAQLESALSQTIPLLPKAFNRVLAKALAAVTIVLYKYGGYIFLQIFVRTAAYAETEINGKILRPLVEWGRLIGTGDPADATQAELVIDIQVTEQGGTLSSGTLLTYAGTGVTYMMTATVNLNAAVVQTTVQAVSDQSGGGGAGSIGNLVAGDKISFINAQPGVFRDATVVSQNVTGADGETVPAYKQRVLDRFQKRPQGGAPADYKLWGEIPAGIINVYPYKSDFPGQTAIFAEATVESSGSADGIPTEAQLTEVKNAIEFDEDGLASRRNIGAQVNVLAITRTGFDVTIFDLIVDNKAQVEIDIEDALNEYFLQREPYIVGLSVPPRKDRITRTGVDGVVEDIVSAAGGIYRASALFLAGEDIPVYNLGQGEKAKMASFTSSGGS